MARISTREYELLQSGLRDLYAHHNLDTLPHAALELANSLVPNDLAAYNEVDPSRRRVQVVLKPAERQSEVMQVVASWERYMHQHPLLAHQMKNPADRPRKISDFLSDEEYRQLELYTECYRKLRANYQIATNVPSPAPLVVALAFNRETKDFSEHERALLDLLRPHLRQAYENAAVISELADELGRAQDLLERMDRGVVVVDERWQVHSASPAAIRFSCEHFGEDPDAGLTKCLPDAMQRWARAQVAALRQDDESADRPTPLIVKGPQGRLIARIVADRQPGRYLITLHVARPLESAAPLEDLGLSKREAEVLRWMVEGKSNPEIGQIVGVSARTVDKHAQNLYSKLDVGGRTAAITRALEWLRL